MSDFAWSGLLCPPPRDLPNPGRKPVSPTSPALAGGFFTTNATWEAGLIPGSRRSPEIGNGNTLQYSCLQNPMDRGTWWATIHGVKKNQTGLSA